VITETKKNKLIQNIRAEVAIDENKNSQNLIFFLFTKYQHIKFRVFCYFFAYRNESGSILHAKS
jgi:hypothetical protein